jgi:hypothetical protein
VASEVAESYKTNLSAVLTNELSRAAQKAAQVANDAAKAEMEETTALLGQADAWSRIAQAIANQIVEIERMELKND